MDTAKKNKILIVDDDTFLLNMYSMKFQKAGLEVATAISGEDALQKLKGGLEPNIIILDIIMPGMDGINLLENVRKEKLVPQATIVMLTNQGDHADIEKAKQLGVEGYIVKATTIPSEVVDEVVKIYNEHHDKVTS